jgi:hypothetical protein
MSQHLEVYKFLVVAVVHETDENGRILRERFVSAESNRPVEVFGVDGLIDWVHDFEAKLQAIELDVAMEPSV